MAHPSRSIVPVMVAGLAIATSAVGQPQEGDEAFCRTGCAGMPNLQQCVAMCLRSPAPKIAFTAEMAPVGTPVPLVVGALTAEGYQNQEPVTAYVAADVAVGGQVIIKKGSFVFGRYVSGSMTQSGLLGTQCSPSVRIVLESELRTYFPKGALVPMRALPGVDLPNVIQRVPLSLKNPGNPAGSEVAEVTLGGCYRQNVPLTAYISGPPSAPNMAAALGR